LPLNFTFRRFEYYGVTTLAPKFKVAQSGY